MWTGFLFGVVWVGSLCLAYGTGKQQGHKDIQDRLEQFKNFTSMKEEDSK